MGAQGFYRQVDAPTYPYTLKSSSPFRWELEITFLTFPQISNHFNYVFAMFPSDRRCFTRLTGVGSWECARMNTILSLDIMSSLWALIGSLTHHSTFFQTLHHIM